MPSLALGLVLALCVPLGCHSQHDEHRHGAGEGHGEHDERDERGAEGAEHARHAIPGRDGEHEGEEEGHVRLSPAALSRSAIRVAPVEAGSLAGSVEVPAEVQVNPDRVAHISPLVEGQLLGVDATLGDRVEAGQEIARLRSIELGQARAALSRANALRKVARQTLDRQKRLRADGISAERSLIEARLAADQANAEREAALSRLRVFGVEGGAGPDMALQSPIAGLVVERHATRGETVSPQTVLFVVADLSRVWVIGRVYEQQLSRVGPGMKATLTLNAYPGRVWSGVVDFVGATIDEATRTLPIRVELDNPDGRLRPGLFGALRLAPSEAGAKAALVPATALQRMENRTVVFVPGDEPGVFEVRPVTVGREGRQQVEVLEGLAIGDPVVVEGAFVLKSELMRDQLGHGHAH